MADCAEPVQTTELVLLPKMAPTPPVARMIASAGKERQFHGAQIERRDAARSAFASRGWRRGTPSLRTCCHFTLGFVAAHLFVERVEKLLAGGCAGECGAVIERAAEAAEVEKTFGGAIEGHTHAIEQVDDAGRGLAHGLDRRLVGQKVAAIDRVVEVLVGGVAFALQVLGRIDAALRADGVRALDRDDGEQVHVAACFSDLDDGGEPGKASANHDDSGSCH